MIEDRNPFILPNGHPRSQAFFPTHVFEVERRQVVLTWQSEASMWRTSEARKLILPSEVAQACDIKWVCPVVADSSMMKAMWRLMLAQFSAVMRGDPAPCKLCGANCGQCGGPVT